MEHIYTSAKGEFLDFATWVNTHGIPEDINVHNNEPNTLNWNSLYKRWVNSEQINSHKIVVDGVETTLEPPAGE